MKKKKQPKLTKEQRERIIKEFGHIPTKEEIFDRIIASQERLAEALAGAWKNAPADAETREKLLEIGEKSAKLRDGIKKAFGKK